MWAWIPTVPKLQASCDLFVLHSGWAFSISGWALRLCSKEDLRFLVSHGQKQWPVLEAESSRVQGQFVQFLTLLWVLLGFVPHFNSRWAATLELQLCYQTRHKQTWRIVALNPQWGLVMEGRFLHPSPPALPSCLPEGAAVGAGQAEQASHLVAAAVLIWCASLRWCGCECWGGGVWADQCPGIASCCPHLADRLFPPGVITAESGSVWVWAEGTDTESLCEHKGLGRSGVRVPGHVETPCIYNHRTI